MNSTRPGTRNQPASMVASSPAISRPPVIRIRLASLTAPFAVSDASKGPYSGPGSPRAGGRPTQIWLQSASHGASEDALRASEDAVKQERVRAAETAQASAGPVIERYEVLSQGLTRASQSGYSSFRQARGSSGCALGVRSSRNEWYGATNGSGAIT